MSGADVAALAADLSRAVELMMNPLASQADRLKAYQACESFKDTSPLCAEAGLYLAAADQSSLVSKHFGLQLMEHMIKYRWTQISQQEKVFIKENAMKLLASGGLSAESYMKDALSRVVVEMVKREWPQQWPGLLNELSDTCACGETQTELVLLVFLRLVEDVALLQTLESNQRRKDIYHALTANMSVIFEFFLRLIELHVGQVRVSSGSPKAAAHTRVVKNVLLTLTGFVEWVSMTHIMAQNGRLLQILCLLLGDSDFQLPAAECLSYIVNRKGKIEERKPLMVLFNIETMQCILSVAKNPGTVFDDHFYLFKKKLIQVLGGMTTQMCTLWSKDPAFRPVNFAMFLEAILAYSSHPSLVLAHAANPLWNSMLKHELVSRDPIFLSSIPQWVQCTAPKLIRFNYPSDNVLNNGQISENLSYARIDFDSEDEYSAFFYRCRSDILSSFRQATIVAPLVTFNCVEQWLFKCLSVPNTVYGLTLTDQFYLEWEALSTFVDSVLSRVLQAPERPPIPSGLNLLRMCLSYQPIDPLILSTLLTCISSLFVFLSMSTGQMAPAANSVAVSGAALLPQVLDKIFSTLLYVPEGQKELVRSRQLKSVRRHAASLIVKIGNKYPLLLLPVFDQIKATIDSLSRPNSPANLSGMEKVTLLEALLLISNHFGDYERQSSFVGEVLRDATAQFLNIVNSGALKSAVEFISFVGLNKPPVPENTDDVCAQNRNSLVFCISLVLGAIKRCSWPDDPERATRGGFVVSLTESGNPVCRNPATPHVLPLLPHILSLARIFNEIFTSEIQRLIHDSYKGCLAMPETERSSLLGLTGHSNDNAEQLVVQSSLQRMQLFLTGLYETCYHMLGSMGPSLGRDLYNIPDLPLAIINSVLSCLQFVPDYRLRPIVRVFLKSFVYSCPAPHYEVVLLPILGHITPIYLGLLHNNWQRVIEFKNREVQEDDADAQEVLEDVLTRALTREYLDLLKVALVGGSLTPESNSETMETEELSNSPTPPPTRSNLTSEVISDLGLILLRSEKTCQPIVLAVLGALSWIDSTASMKATQLIGPIVKQLTIDASLNGEMATQIMVAVLNALILHGQHEANQASLLTLGTQVYEMLRPSFVEVLAVMQQIPGVNPVDLQKLDERISGSTSKGNKVEKVKKDLFKKLTSSLIGKSMGQLFKKEVKMNSLPQIVNAKKEKSDVIPDLRNIYGS